MAVVTADKFHDFVALRKASGKTQRAHRRFRPRIHHADHLDGRIHAHHQTGQFRLCEGRCSITGAALRRFLQRFNYPRMSVPDDHWPP